MTGTRVKITIDDREFRRVFAELQRRGVDLGPAMREIAAEMESVTRGRFEKQAGPGGRAWIPSIRARETGGQTLRDTGRLLQSITSLSRKNVAIWGTNVIYAAIQQFGGTIHAKSPRGLRFKIGDRFVTKQSVTLPARPFLGLDKTDERTIREILGDYLTAAARPGAAS